MAATRFRLRERRGRVFSSPAWAAGRVMLVRRAGRSVSHTALNREKPKPGRCASLAIRLSACETFPRAHADFKPLASIGKGVEEIRVLESSGAYRVIYLARRADAVYVLRANLRARAELMQKIAARLRQHDWTQDEAARGCGVTPPRINDLLRGRVSRFSLDALVNIATALGFRVRIDLEAA